MSKNITSPDSTPEKSSVGNEDLNYLWHLLLEFGLEYDGVVDDKQ